MISCFENLVGIRKDCGDTVASDSGFYLQDLTFINLKLGDSIVTTQDSGYDVLKGRLDFATNYLENDLRTRMNGFMRMSSVIENDVVGYYEDNKNLNTGVTDLLKGIQIELNEYPSLTVFISHISLFTDYTGTIPVYVYDLIQGKLLDTISVTTVAGQITTLDIHKAYKSNGQALNLFIGYDSTNVGSYTSNIYKAGTRGCRTCPNSGKYGNKFVSVYAMGLDKNSPKIQNNLQSINEAGGISLTYSLKCSVEKFMCQMRDSLAFALLHRAGVEILKEARVSTRLNHIVVTKKEEIDTLIEWYDSEYQKSMSNIFTNLKLPNDICLKCDARIQTGITMP